MERIKVLASNILPYLMLAQMLLTYIIAEGLLDMWPQVVNYVALALGWIGSAIYFLRRVAPVEKDDRGLLEST